jgi:hypothetical protein
MPMTGSRSSWGVLPPLPLRSRHRRYSTGVSTQVPVQVPVCSLTKPHYVKLPQSHRTSSENRKPV